MLGIDISQFTDNVSGLCGLVFIFTVTHKKVGLNPSFRELGYLWHDMFHGQKLPVCTD